MSIAKIVTSVVFALTAWTVDLPASYEAGTLTVAPAAACEGGIQMARDTANCGLAENNFRGTDGRARKTQVTVCLSRQELARITLPDGSYAWELELLAPNGWRAVARTIYNQPCATQNVEVGVRLLVEVTCDLDGDGRPDAYFVASSPARHGMRETMRQVALR